MDKLLNGLSVTAIGMIIVFFGLVVLIFCISLLRNFARDKSAQEASSDTDSVTEAPAAEPVAAGEAAYPAQADELIAVLTAAIAALWEGEQQGFVVRRVRRVHANSAWEKAGREEQIYSRM